MKADWKYLRKVVLAYAGMTMAMIVVLMEVVVREHVESAGAGAALSLMNFLLGFLAIEYSYERSHTTFLKVVLGGMIVRLLAMTAAVVVLIKVCEFDALVLMLTLLGYYVVNLMFEVVFLQKKVSLKKPS
ncbi:MAG TPA: hypothetical protein VJN65_06155 [Bacteroidota bacterium]|nr:hypothetical protein [Bacteroidota bacterium]